MDLDDAIRTAEQLAASVRDTGVQPAYAELETAIRGFQEEGYPLESILPQGSDARLGFSMRSADGRTFFQIYAALLRKSLCGADGEFNKLIKSGTSSSVGAILGAMVIALGIPPIALGIMVPVAAIIANLGLDSFCEMTKPEG